MKIDDVLAQVALVVEHVAAQQRIDVKRRFEAGAQAVGAGLDLRAPAINRASCWVKISRAMALQIDQGDSRDDCIPSYLHCRHL